MPRSAGNPNMSSGLDASGSSSMGDIFQSFQNGGSNWGKRFEKQGARSVGRLTINGLGTDVTQAMVRAFLEPFYNTVQEVRLIPGRGGGMGGASVSFGFAAERDKAASELNGRGRRWMADEKACAATSNQM